MTRVLRNLLIVAAVVLPSSAAAEIIHSEQSLYHNILVVERGSERCLQFTVRRDQRNQSCIDLDDHRKLVFDYTRMMLAALLIEPAPERILMVGLGGGSLPRALSELLPEAQIDVVEIDPAVVEIAEAFFDFTPTSNMDITVQDARVYGKRAALRGERYDLVLLDAFGGDYIPEHLLTREYLEETRSLLSEDGVLAANTFESGRLYDHESETYRAVFGRFFNLTLPETRNRIIIATKGELPSQEALEEAARRWAPSMRPLHAPIERYPERMSTRRGWDTEARILTDQYAPGNLLREMN